MASLFCNVVVKFGEGAVEAEQGATRELAWKMSHSTQHSPQRRRFADAAEDMLDPLLLAVSAEGGFSSTYAPEL